MADFDANFRYDSDFTKVTEDIKALVREATNANSVFAQLNKTAASVKMEAARSFSAQAGFAGFKSQIVDLTGATEQFGQQLMKNKLTMKEYFKEAANSYKKDSKARALAEREVRRNQSAVVGMGDINGRRKGILVTPQSLDMTKANTQLEIASKQYEIFNDLVQKGSTALVNWGKNTQWAGRQLTVGLTVPMSIFASQALKAFAEVDQEVTRFKKVYGSDLTTTVGNSTDEMLRQVQNMGSEFAKNFGIASKETIALAADLASAGFEGQKLLTALNQTTRLMVLGEVDRQDAMKATLSIQTAFNQSSKELAQSVDFLNQVENQTSASLQDLVDAIPKAGPVVQALGGDVKDLSVLMTALREGGISAGEGANALKSGMAALISPTNKAIEVSRQLGIDLEGVVKRNRGKLMPMLIDFQDQLSGLDEFGKAKVIEEIFGKYQFARISALFDNLNQQGSQTIGMLKLMNTSADDLAKKSYSELQAQQRAPSTRLAAMQQQLQEQLIRVGADLAETLLPIMQGALDILQKIVDGFNNLPGPIKSFAKIIAGVTAAAGPILMLAGIFGNLVGNAIKFGMSIVNLFKKMTGHPVQQLQILSDEELAAKLAANQLTGAYERQRTSVMELNAALDIYIANLRTAATIAPPGAVSPGPRRGPSPIRRAEGGVIYAKNGVDSGGKINGYGGGDTVPAMLEPGEFVINKKSSKKYAPLLRDINQGKNIPGHQLGTDGGVGDVYKKLSKSTLNPYAKDVRKTLDSLLKEALSNPKTASSKLILDTLSMSQSSRQEYLRAYGEKMGFNPYAMSHIEPAVNIAIGKTSIGSQERVYSLPKAYAGMTFTEPYLYNGSIQALSSLINAPKNSSYAEMIKRSHPDAYAILTNERAPQTLSEFRSMASLYSDEKLLTSVGYINPENQKGFNFNNNVHKDAKSYLERMAGMPESEFARTRKTQWLSSQIVNLSPSRKKELFYEIVNGKRNPMSDFQIMDMFLSNGTGISSEAKLRYQSIIKSIDKTFAGNIETERLAKRLNLVANVLSENGPVVSGKNSIEKASASIEQSIGRSKEEAYFGSKRSNKAVGSQAVEAFYKEESAISKKITAAAAESAGMKSLMKLFRSRFKNGGLIRGYAGGGLVGGLMQIMSLAEKKALPGATEMLQKGFNVSRLQGTELAALRKKQTGLMHDTKMFRGTKYNWDNVQVGQEIRLPGSQSWSTREDVADSFRAMNELGAEKNLASISTDTLLQAGINPKTFGRSGAYPQFRIATTPEETILLNRIERIKEQQRGRKNLNQRRELLAQRKALESSPLPSQESTLFGMTEPLPYEVANRKKALEELDRKINETNVDYIAAKEQMTRRRNNMRTANDSPVIFEMVTPKGTQTLPLSDITGRGRMINGMGAMDEFEHLITDGTMRVVKKYVDERGVKRIVGEFVGARKFSTGGKLPGFGGGDKVPAMLEPGEFVINKNATKNNLGLLQQINGGVLKRKSGGIIPGYAAGGLVAEAGMMGMNLMFLPMMYEQAKASEGTMQKMLYALVAIQGMVGVIQAAQLLGGIKGAIGNKVAAGKIGAVKNLAGMGVKGSAGIVRQGGMAAFTAARGAGAGIMQSLGLAAGASLGPILAVGAAVAAIGVGIYLWRKHIDDLANTSRSYYKEATEMAKVYNIEINKSRNALAENRKYAEAFGTASAITAKGQTDKDYAAAIKKDYEEAINGIKDLNNEQDKSNRLASIYSSLVTQGFSLTQAKEITAEIARQAEATSAFNSVYPKLQSAIKDTETAMQVLDTTFAYHMSQLGTAEEKVAALTEAYTRLQAASNINPTQSVVSTQNLISTSVKNGGAGAVGDLVNAQLANAGINQKGVDSILQNLAGTTDVNWASQTGQDLATTILAGLNAGMTEKDFTNAMSLEDVKVKVGVQVSMQDAKLALNKELELVIKELQDGITKVNKLYDDKIAAVEAEKKAIEDAHDKKMKALEEEGNALRDRGDLIRDNTDFYIKQLEKEYNTEQYYQQQRKNAASGLESLSKGDIFGYLQSQMQTASDAAQFGREQAIQQIQDTRDAALAALDAQIKANDAAKGALDEATQKQLDGKDNQIQALNIARSKIIKDLNSRIKEAQAIMNSPEIATKKIDEFQTKLGKTVEGLPTKLQKPFETVGENLAGTVSTTLNKKASEINSVFVNKADVLKNAIRAALGTVTQAYDPKTGKAGTSIVLPGGYEIKITNQNPEDAGNKFDDSGTSLPNTPPQAVSKKKYQVGKAYQFGQSTYTLMNNGNGYWWQGSSMYDTKPVLQYKNRGGKIMKYNTGTGRAVPGFGSSDTVPAMLTPGEFISDATATRRNLPVLQAMNAGATFTLPQLRAYNGTMDSGSETYNNSVNMPVNITINGSNLTIDQIKNDIYGELVKAKNMVVNSIGESR